MPGVVLPGSEGGGMTVEEPEPLDPYDDGPDPEYLFVVSHQKLAFEVDFPTQSLTGYTEITILPQSRDLAEIKINARQCIIPQGGIQVNGSTVERHEYEDRMKYLNIRENIGWGVHQHRLQREKVHEVTQEDRNGGALVIPIPEDVQIEEVDLMSDAGAVAVSRAVGASARHSSAALDGGSGRQNTPTAAPKYGMDQSTSYKPLVIRIPFSVKKFRDGLHFAGLMDGDTQYPHVYTRHSIDRGMASFIFPCVDDPSMRCTWEIVVTCSRTLGDAMKTKKNHPQKSQSTKKGHANDALHEIEAADEDEILLNEADKLLEMTVTCSGELIEEANDPDDSSKKVVTFYCTTIVAPQHVGFGIGPFEQVDLSDLREAEEGDKIGQGQLIPVIAYCLPGRSLEVRHTCMPLTHAADWFMLNFGNYPFNSYSILFIDGQVNDVEHTAGLSICTDRLLFPPEIIDPELENVRTLVHGLASQWITVCLVAETPKDRWLTIGLSHFMTGLFMKELCGENAYVFRQKLLSDELVREDVQRPCLEELGPRLSVGRFEMDFMKLKAPLVLFILDKRLFKFTSGTAGLMRIVSKLITQANIGSSTDSIISTTSFRAKCEKITRYRQINNFIDQWVQGVGCPRMRITHKFNKKRLCVEVSIQQTQPSSTPTGQKLRKESFLREFMEHLKEVYTKDPVTVFTGSMTIRIHEADGSPYEHVIEIKNGKDTIQIPYNTKYKRVKRNILKKDRMNNLAQGDANGELSEDTVLYSLGDTLQSNEEMDAWGMQDWDEELKKTMDAENYEWIRMDSDFEWLCDKEISMPSYMFVSQLQQDKDVAAQQESMQYFSHSTQYHPVAATVLTRTLMDARYFHGIRTMAAAILKTHATSPTWTGFKHLQKAYSEFFCYPGTMMPRSNDFTNRRLYYVELAIPQAMSNIRDPHGFCPKQAREFILDQLRFNDNTNNEYSDVYKIAGLLKALTNALIPQKGAVEVLDGDLEDEEPKQFRAKAIEELDRHRRMDEWINSYQNVLTTTVLECKMALMKAKVIRTDKNEFLRYLIDGNLEQVRIKGFEALIELGFLSDTGVLKFLLCCLSTDPSPFVRARLFEVFVLGLARIVLEEEAPPKASVVMPEIDDAGLQVEENPEMNTSEQQAFILRTTTIQGAMAALKQELKENEVLKEALMNALHSPSLTAREQLNLLDICHILYDQETRYIAKVKLPRYWKVRKVAQGKLHFKQTGSLRTEPCKPWKPSAPPILPNVHGAPVLTTSSKTASAMSVPPPAQSQAPAQLSQSTAGGLGATSGKLKLTFSSLGGVGSKSTASPAAQTAPPLVKPTPSPSPAVMKPLPAQGGMKPPPKRAADEGPNVAAQPDPKRRKLIVKLNVNGSKLKTILARPPAPSITVAIPRSDSASKKRKSDSPDSSNKKAKTDATGASRVSSTPKKASTPRESPAPKASPAPAPIALQPAPASSPISSSPAVSSSAPPSSAPVVKPPRQRLPDAPPRPVVASPPVPASSVKKTTLKLKFTTKPKVTLPTPSSDNSPKPSS